jgi:hypothetical protein
MTDIEPVRTEFTFEANISCDPPRVVGPGKYGQHQVIPINGGSFAGPRIRGEVLPGGADSQLIRADGVLELEARYTIRAEDGALITVRNRGLANMAESDANGVYVRTIPEFEAAVGGSHEWLNKWLFVGTLRVVSFNPILVQVRVFRVL